MDFERDSHSEVCGSNPETATRLQSLNRAFRKSCGGMGLGFRGLGFSVVCFLCFPRVIPTSLCYIPASNIKSCYGRLHMFGNIFVMTGGRVFKISMTGKPETLNPELCIMCSRMCASFSKVRRQSQGGWSDTNLRWILLQFRV